jgi:hypothetical protein
MIDSASFVSLANTLRESRFFGIGPFDGAGEHPPLVEESWVVTAATYCRREVTTFVRRPDMSNGPYRVVPVIDSVVRSLKWEKVVFRDVVGQ